MDSYDIDQEELNAIAGGYHGDPFRVLGPHVGDDGLVIRTFLPDALLVELLVPESSPLRMNQIHVEGIFEVVLSETQAPEKYAFKAEYTGAEAVIHEDPYAYPSLLSEFDLHLLAEGTHYQMYNKVGAHIAEANGRQGVHFVVWAPDALRVSVIGDFNLWDGRRHPMRFHPGAGLWELFIPGMEPGTHYKYEVKTRYLNYTVAKSDPVGFFAEMRPNTASIVWDNDQYQWQDTTWLQQRSRHNDLNGPISIYEVHLGSWRLKNGWEWLTYQELAEQLIPYVKDMGYTHIELLPVTEHPFDGSWGYQVTGFFAPTSRFGTPDDFKAFVDACHQSGIGVILDWVPAHFPTDEHGLAFFDGTHLYEHADPRQGTQPDWGTLVFNFGRNEVRQFLVANALYWLDKFHIDGLRVDAVASMLYLDFSRNSGEWIPNRLGGRDNIEAIEFLRLFNDQVHQNFPNVLTIAEESTAWGGVTHPTADGGLGFDLKWNMGWMHDSLRYLGNEPIHRSYHQGTLTFSLLYAFTEKFLLPLSHDEVVHLKKSLLDKMPGDLWQRFANLRLLYGYQWAHPGKKLLFMGGEIGQWQEWSEARSLDWQLLDAEGSKHRLLQDFVKALNQLYTSEPALYADDNSWNGFTWLDFQDGQRSILSFARLAPDHEEVMIVACNFTPVVRTNYRLGVPKAGTYRELLNSDAVCFGGSNVLNSEPMHSSPVHCNDQPHSIEFTLPPLAVTFLKLQK